MIIEQIDTLIEVFQDLKPVSSKIDVFDKAMTLYHKLKSNDGEIIDSDEEQLVNEIDQI